MERSWMCTYPTPTLWVRMQTPPQYHASQYADGFVMTATRSHSLSFRCPPRHLPTWRLLAVPQVQLQLSLNCNADARGAFSC